MCFGGSPKTPDVPAPPAPSPAPVPSDVNPQQTEGQRANRVRALQYGLQSTIKTTPQGVVGQGADLNAPAAQGIKNTIGS
jgi:hypothetical protein